MNNFVLDANWVDLIILIILAYYAFEAVRHGLLVIMADFISFLGALLISLRAYRITADFLREQFNLAHSVSNAVGFLLTAIIAEAILGFLLAHLITRLSGEFWKEKWNRIVAILPAIGEGLIIVAFILTLAVALPIRPDIKRDIVDSRVGGYILARTTQIERAVNEIFGGVIEDSLTYLTIRPDSRESVNLTVESFSLSEDERAESEMFSLVNQERRNAGIHELEWFPNAVPVAREHARDMWERKYFSHVSPDGKDVGDRLSEGGVGYTFAGENLALAPTTPTAHTGLMNSEGHRANILERRFSRMGIGVIDNGVYGKMYVQVFTD